jgi:hypothetical protein
VGRIDLTVVGRIDKNFARDFGQTASRTGDSAMRRRIMSVEDAPGHHTPVVLGPCKGKGNTKSHEQPECWRTTRPVRSARDHIGSFRMAANASQHQADAIGVGSHRRFVDRIRLHIVQFFDRMEALPGAKPARLPNAPSYLGLMLISSGFSFQSGSISAASMISGVDPSPRSLASKMSVERRRSWPVRSPWS